MGQIDREALRKIADLASGQRAGSHPLTVIGEIAYVANAANRAHPPVDDETKLRYDIARILHSMFCHCGKPMSEYPYQSSWLTTADDVLNIIRQNHDIKPRVP